jgi:hypothetical protein
MILYILQGPTAKKIAASGPLNGGGTIPLNADDPCGQFEIALTDSLTERDRFIESA